MSMNERVIKVVREQADAFYEGTKSSVEAFTAIDFVSSSAWNWYPNIVNDTRQAFDLRVTANIDRDVDEHRQETYESRELRRVRDNGLAQDAEGVFWIKVTASGEGSYGPDTEAKWLALTPAQLDAVITALELKA